MVFSVQNREVNKICKKQMPKYAGFFCEYFFKIKYFYDIETALLRGITIETLWCKQKNYAKDISKYRTVHTITRNIVILIAVLVYKYTNCRIGIKMNQLLSNYWENVNRILKERNMSMAELSRQSQISPSSMHDLRQNGRNPGILHFIKIAETLNVDFARLFTSPEEYIKGVDNEEVRQVCKFFITLSATDRTFVIEFCKRLAENPAQITDRRILQIPDFDNAGEQSPKSVYKNSSLSKEIAEKNPEKTIDRKISENL